MNKYVYTYFIFIIWCTYCRSIIIEKWRDIEIFGSSSTTTIPNPSKWTIFVIARCINLKQFSNYCFTSSDIWTLFSWCSFIRYSIICVVPFKGKKIVTILLRNNNRRVGVPHMVSIFFEFESPKEQWGIKKRYQLKYLLKESTIVPFHDAWTSVIFRSLQDISSSC